MLPPGPNLTGGTRSASLECISAVKKNVYYGEKQYILVILRIP
jgi:hypothetical protein